MKVQLKETETEQFKPFTIELTVESNRELDVLWNLFVIPNKVMADFLNEQGVARLESIEPKDLSFSSDLFFLINRK